MNHGKHHGVQKISCYIPFKVNTEGGEGEQTDVKGYDTQRNLDECERAVRFQDGSL